MILSNDLKNQLLDALFRGQELAPFPGPNLYLGLVNGSSQEPTAPSYERIAIPISLLSWSGTQGAGTIAVSSGTSGKISNNNILEFPDPLEAWGTVASLRFFLTSTGTEWFCQQDLPNEITVQVGDSIVFYPGDIEIEA